jgi:hypothetical protein
MGRLRYPNPVKWPIHIPGVLAMLDNPPTTYRWRVHWNRRSKPSIGARRRPETKK